MKGDNTARKLEQIASQSYEQPVQINDMRSIEDLERLANAGLTAEEIYLKFKELGDFGRVFIGQYDAMSHLLQHYRRKVKEDETKLKDLRDKVRQRTEESLTDKLTQLPNRAKAQMFTNEFAALANIHNHPLSVLFIDLDYFGEYNKKYGHGQGDIALKTFANILKSTIPKDAIAARQGGEEFVVVLPETDEESAYKIAENIRLGLKKTEIPSVIDAYEAEKKQKAPEDMILNYDGRHKYFTASLGVFTYRNNMNKQLGFTADSVDRFDVLAGLADKAMLQAKNSGRDRTAIYGQTKQGLASKIYQYLKNLV